MGRQVTDHQLRIVGLLVFIYLVAFFLGSAAIAAFGYSLDDAVFEFTSALSTVGLSVGITSPNAPLGLLWILIGTMFLGRMEFFTIIVGLIWIVRDLPVLLFSRQ